MLNGGQSGPHKIPGIVPFYLYSSEDIDEDIQNDDAIKAGRDLAQREGLLVRTHQVLLPLPPRLRSVLEQGQGTVVALLPDTGERYLSTVLYAFEEYPL